MKNFMFYNPTKIIFGKGTVNKISSEINERKLKKVLFLYGKGSIFKNGVYKEIISSLYAKNISFVEVGGIKPNPILSKVKEAIDIARANNVDSILAVGGGSVIDSAKAVAAGYYYEGDVWDFFERKSHVKKALPIFTILTISATGSEMNSGGVITNEKEYKKWAFGSPVLFPKVSVIDPTIQFSLPWSQTANGVIDAMAHVFELYFNGVQETDIQDEIAEGILRTLIKHAKILKEDSTNYNSRSQIAWSATLALNGLNAAGRGSGDWASHFIEHSLSAFYDIPHGEGLGIIMPAWMEYVYKYDIDKFAKFARNVFNLSGIQKEELAFRGIQSFREFVRSLDKPVYLHEIGIKDSEIEKIASNASQIPMGSIKKLNYNDILKILELAF